jgi:DNA polymerase III delta subunit
MIYFIHGDTQKSFKKATQLVDSMLAKKPDAELFKISVDDFGENKLQDLIGGQSLFAKKYIVQMSRMLEDEVSGDIVLKNLKEVADSENVFVWVEEKVKAPALKKIEKVAEKVQEFKLSGSTASSKSKKDSGLNVFALADAFGSRDRKKLWALYTEAIKESIPAEEINGILWWQLKSIILVTKTKSAKEAGMKDFPYNKSQRFAQNFSADELQEMSDKMIEIYHESRRGGAELAVRLEKFLLEV